MTSDDSIWAALPVPALVIDAEDRIARINPAAEGFMLSSERTLIGQPIWDRLAVNAPLDAAFERARQSGAPLFVNDVDVGTGERAPMQCNLQIAPLPGQAGHMIMLIETRELAGRMVQNSNVKSAAKSAIGMAEMLAHEIKNPLAGITGAAQLLSMNVASEDMELTDLIVSESRRIVSLLERVEQFGNITAPDLRPINLHDVLDRARRSAMLGFAAHMTLIEDYDPSLPLALGDTDQLLQVVLNLLKNAAEASKGKPGTIRLHSYYEQSLRLRRDKTDGRGKVLPLQIEIIDDGPGLPPRIAEQVFDPFVSGRENGTGLGLALISKIVADHEGWIAVDSVPGRTVFRISLQRAAVTRVEDDENTVREG
jgi:two-component system nitrogen regulation sensor histidine kinase GlnL